MSGVVFLVQGAGAGLVGTVNPEEKKESGT